MENLRHWSALSKTDPKHTKPFQRAGGFKGTATRPIWTEYRLTEHFGPCGRGWGFDEPVFTLAPAGEEILVFCTLRCWYAEGEGTKPATLYGVGGDKVLIKQQSGLRADDEAYKKAFTDALGNAFKHLGSGADVHMGLFEDSKYVAAMRKEFADDNASVAPTPPAGERAAAPVSNGAANGKAPLTRAESAAYPSDRERRAKAATEAKRRITEALGAATTPALIDDIIKINADDLAEIKSLHEPSYTAVMQLAGRLKTEMYGSMG